MKLRPLKYLPVYTGLAATVISFSSEGWWTYTALIYTFFLIPILDMLMPAPEKNMTAMEEELALKDPLYDWMVYLMLPIQYGFLVWFLVIIDDPTLTTFEMWGRITAMGILCGSLGINVAHELGHRTKKYEQWMSKSLLLTSLYMHFFIEHNRGHHKRVATPDDPASARYGENIYFFYVRSVVFSYVSAWKLEAKKLQQKQLAFWSIHNEMLRFQFIQLALLVGIYFAFGLLPMLAFIAAAAMGFLQLETVNYIEHYGLQRRQRDNGNYEKVLPIHSWNSNHILGRLLLFELTRHSDHHFKASRKYQILRHFDDAPQMPTGYPGMMLLATIPPLWFAVMHRHIAKCKKEYGGAWA
ncbi:MAG: alkane 1-monooxygenase [Chitinophagales bacterium]